MEEAKKEAVFPEVESAVEVTKEMQMGQIRNPYEDVVFLRQKKVKKPRKTLWCGLYDLFMCRKCSETKK